MFYLIITVLIIHLLIIERITIFNGSIFENMADFCHGIKPISFNFVSNFKIHKYKIDKQNTQLDSYCNLQMVKDGSMQYC